MRHHVLRYVQSPKHRFRLSGKSCSIVSCPSV
jgi:hypothetical protein